MRRVWVAFALLMALVLTATSAYAYPKPTLPRMASEKVKAQAINATLAANDFKTVAESLRREGISLDTSGSIVTEGGKSPAGNLVYTVAMAERTTSRNKNTAVLAFVEDTPKGVIVHAVGVVRVSPEDARGNRILSMSGPKHGTVRSTFDAKTGKVVSMTVEGNTKGQATAEAVGVDSNSVCSWTCWLAGTIACTTVCTPLSILGVLTGIVCGVVCSAVFNWVCSHCP